MPVSIWLNENERSLDRDEWVTLILKFQQIFRDTFGFVPQLIELWSGSFFTQSGGIIISSNKVEDLGTENSLETLLDKALQSKLIMKVSGIMRKPIEIKSFIVCFLNSEDRWGMPHIFFDSEFEDRDLIDVLWENDDRRSYMYSLLDDIQHVRVKIFNKEHKIIDRMVIARDFPDNESIKDRGILLYYLSGPEHRIIKDFIRNYSEKDTIMKKKISELNIREVSERLYRDKEISLMWQKEEEDVSIIPVGSLALISESEIGIPKLFSQLETNVVEPFINNIPANLLDNILISVKKTGEKNRRL